MARFTEDNTEGFTAEELVTLNEAQDRIEAANFGVDPINISDALSNAWTPGITVDDLVSAF